MPEFAATVASPNTHGADNTSFKLHSYIISRMDVAMTSVFTLHLCFIIMPIGSGDGIGPCQHQRPQCRQNFIYISFTVHLQTSLRHEIAFVHAWEYAQSCCVTWRRPRVSVG